VDGDGDVWAEVCVCAKRSSVCSHLCVMSLLYITTAEGEHVSRTDIVQRVAVQYSWRIHIGREAHLAIGLIY